MITNDTKQPHFLYFASPFLSSKRVELETSKLVDRLSIVFFYSGSEKLRLKGALSRSHDPFLNFGSPVNRIFETGKARRFKFGMYIRTDDY